MDTRARQRLLAQLPRIDDLVAAATALTRRYGVQATTAAFRRAVDAARSELVARGGDVPLPGALTQVAEADLSARFPGPPVAVINATGVVLHTNLGRAPLSPAAGRAMLAAAGYCDLEFDLATGRRGSRGARLDPLIAEVCGAEAGFAVNNGAAALVLTLTALGAGRQVPVARGELVEIGGSFRLPEIMAASGAQLLEVGTTNRTRPSDYRAGGDVALLLKVHPSNYSIDGFTESVPVAELAAVARQRDVPLVYDVGSGLLADAHQDWLAAEPSVRGALAAGADLVICSGDKLLGGPQAGLLVGRRDLVDTCRRHPLHRALRLDKLRVAALVATLEQHLRGERPPTWEMLEADADILRQRSDRLAERIGGTVVDGTALVGGGSAPAAELPTPVVRLDVADPDRLAATLRTGAPPIVARVRDGALWLNLRTVPAADDEHLAARLAGR